MVILHETVHYGRDQKFDSKNMKTISNSEKVYNVINYVNDQTGLKDSKEVMDAAASNVNNADDSYEAVQLFEAVSVGRTGSKGKDQTAPFDAKIYLRNAQKSAEELKKTE